MIKAPFNFVPLPDQVVFPDWAPIISHDVPFSDGISGTIGIRLTAETPIFVRNGHSRSEKDSKGENYDTFCQVGDRFFLPGTTVKGAVRNVLEILSFGKMRLDRNARFAQREWDNTTLYPMKQEQQSVRCGWLRIKEDGSCEITDCGKPRRISQDCIDEYLGRKVFKEEFSQDSRLKLTDKRKIGDEYVDPKTAYCKYRLIERMGGLERLNDLRFSPDEKRVTERNKLRMKVDERGKVSGTIVLTGQPDQWMTERPKKFDPRAGKYYEFVFESPAGNAKVYSMSEEEFNQYKFIYADSIDWKYANEKMLPTTGIPVFFRADKDRIIDWGLAFLYKLPYRKTPYDAMPSAHRSEEHDMAECIFGYAEKDASLKGRVQFSPFMSGNARLDAKSYRLVLNGPKASYYPMYIDQKGKGSDGVIRNSYLTYNDGTIRGWKRYLRRDSTWQRKSESEDVDTYIRPVKAGAVFEGSVRFHNLRPEELGALLSAITYHGNEGTCTHQIGMAKPYGYGKVSVKVTDVRLRSVGAVKDDALRGAKDYMAIFEGYMADMLGLEWAKSPTVRELLTMARFDVPRGGDFEYMVLKMDGRNDFSEAKGGRKQAGPKYYLQAYSELINDSLTPDSLVAGHESLIKSRLAALENKREILKGLKEKEAQARKHKEDARKQEEEARQVKEKEEQQREAVRIQQQKQQEELDRKRKEFEGKQLEAELVLKQQQEEELKRQKELEAAKAAKAAAGLTFLEEVNALGEYKVRNLKTLRDRLSNYLKKTIKSDRVPDDQISVLSITLRRLAGVTDGKKANPWKNRNSDEWKYVEKVTSNADADSLFAAVNS